MLNAIDTVYKSIIGLLWNATITFGLNPKYAFLVPFTSSSSFENLDSYVSGTLFSQAAVIIILISSALTLVYNSLLQPKSYGRYIARVTASLIIGSISFFLIISVFGGLDTLYSSVFSTSGVNWSNFLLFSSNVSLSGGQTIVDGNYAALIEIFTLTGYFTAVVALFAELMLRQALMLFALLLLPIGTALYALDHGRRFATILWEILIEMSVYPFLVLACLYFAHIFSWDMPLQLAFLFLPSLLPGIFFATGNSFLSTPVMGFLGGMSLSRTVGKGVEAGSIIGGAAGGAGAAATLKSGILFPVTEKNPLSRNMPIPRRQDQMPWKELLEEELKYRRE